MMKIIILGLLIITVSTAAFGLDYDEQAMILNQELQFLQEAAKNPRIKPTTTASKPQNKMRSQDLEKTYFGNEQEDNVSTSRAARRRKRGTD